MAVANRLTLYVSCMHKSCVMMCEYRFRVRVAPSPVVSIQNRERLSSKKAKDDASIHMLI